MRHEEGLHRLGWAVVIVLWYSMIALRLSYIV